MEQIIDGAQVCRFCGRDQPAVTEEKRGRSRRRRWTFILIFAVLLAVVIFIFLADQGQQHIAMCESAATMARGFTVDQCMKLIHDSGFDVAKVAIFGPQN
jgi:predicted nucleic acid-binding Zn ribbon protein